MDVPEFVDVPSIVNGYEQDRTINGSVGASVGLETALANVLTLGLGGSRTMSDKPTITYTPQTGSEFTRNLIDWIPPASILNLIESGTPADVIMELAVESINGVRNRGFTGTLQKGDPEFQQVIQTLKEAQTSGYVSLRVLPGAKKPRCSYGNSGQRHPSRVG